MITDKPFTFDRVVRLALAAGLIWAAVALLRQLSGALVPFAVALVLAYLLDPAASALQKLFRGRRGPAVIATLFVSLIFAVAVLWIVIPVVTAELTHMGHVVANFAGDSQMARTAAERLPPDLWAAAQELMQKEEVRQFLTSDGLLGLAKQAAAHLLPGIWDVVTGAWQAVLALTGLLVIALYALFLLLDFDRLRGNWLDLAPEPWREPIRATATEFEEGMRRYFRGQVLVAAIVGVLFALGFGLIGLPLGVLLGLFIGLLNIVPYLQILGLVPAFAMAVLQALELGLGFWEAALPVAGVFLVVQSLQDLVLVPRIMGRQMGLSPWVILLSLSIWGQLLGFLGLIIALPLTVFCLAWWRRLMRPLNQE
ncbi:MAG: AI-2E family transporter [Desulfovibrio sp.]